MPTPPAAPPKPPRTTQSRDEDDDDEHDDDDEEKDDHEGDDEDEDEEDEDDHDDFGHGGKKSWPWPHDGSDGNEVHFPTTNPIVDVLTKLAVEFQRTGHQPELGELLRVLTEQASQRSIHFDAENHPGWRGEP